MRRAFVCAAVLFVVGMIPSRVTRAGWAGRLDPSTPTTTSVSADPSPSRCGDKVLLTATVTPKGGSGAVQFKDGTNPLGTAALDTSGAAQLSVTGLAVGPHSFTAVYAGDEAFLGSASDPLAHSVQLAASQVALQVTPVSSYCGAKITLTVSVTPSTAEGSVQFFDGNTLLGSRNLDASAGAQFSIAGLALGTHSFHAEYSGDGCLAANLFLKAKKLRWMAEKHHLFKNIR